MLLAIYPRYKRVSNSSAPSEFVWEKFDFSRCDGVESNVYAWAVCSMLCFVFGFPATVAVLCEMFKICRRSTALSPNDFFMLNLSTMDAVFLVFIPPGIMNHFIWMYWDFEAVWNSVYALNSSGRPLLMACTCLDCYLAVVHPVVYHKRKGLAPRVVIAGIVWTLTIASGIAYFLVYKLYYSMFPVVVFLIAFVIIVVCDGFIIHTLKKSGPGRNNIHPQKQRAIQTVIFSLVMVVISYLPPILLFLIGGPLMPSDKMFICTIGIPITVTSTLGSVVMPLLYLYNAGKLDFLKVGCCKL